MWIDMLLGKKNGEEAADKTAGSKPEAPIQYNPKLVPELKDEHQAALRLLEQIGQAHSAGNAAEASALLEKFGGVLTAHLLKEDFRLYAYLEHSLTSDPATQTIVRQFHDEMGSTGKAALGFLAKYRSIAAAPALPESFAAELADLGKLLRERISREEATLYPMYLPAY
jgi:hemerythrin-like domain-containing protein